LHIQILMTSVFEVLSNKERLAEEDDLVNATSRKYFMICHTCFLVCFLYPYNGQYAVLSKSLIFSLEAYLVTTRVWRQGDDIRDVISIGKLVRKNDGPEEVEQILSTMIKYGESI
jgi:hypothetical protein